MPIISDKSQSQQLLARLQTIYATPHGDTAAELLENEKLLAAALQAGATEDLLASKLLAVSKAHGQHRRKLHTLISGRYWEQTLQQTQGITARGYTPPTPREVKNWTLEP